MKMPKFGIMISAGENGGFYFSGGWSWRLCLGRIAITAYPVDGDEILLLASRFAETIRRKEVDIVVHYPENDPEYDGDYSDVELFVDGEPIRAWGDDYHEKGLIKAKSFYSGMREVCNAFLHERHVADR